MTLTNYESRREERRGLANIKDSIDASIQRLEDFIEKHRGRVITATRNNTDNTSFNRTEMTQKQKWEEKQLYGRFKQLTSDITQNNAIRTNHIGYLVVEMKRSIT